MHSFLKTHIVKEDTETGLVAKVNYVTGIEEDEYNEALKYGNIRKYGNQLDVVFVSIDIPTNTSVDFYKNFFSDDNEIHKFFRKNKEFFYKEIQRLTRGDTLYTLVNIDDSISCQCPFFSTYRYYFLCTEKVKEHAS